MDIPNLSNTTSPVSSNPITNPTSSSPVYLSVSVLAIVAAVGLVVGFGLSRLLPFSAGEETITPATSSLNASIATKKEDVQVGKTYGNLQKNFKDSATGKIQSGGINGEGTHTLTRDGGTSQNAALTSSVVDLDLFIGRKVEINGETNSSSKTGWFLDVGSVKVLE